MREDIRACKFIQWLKSEDKEENEDKWVGVGFSLCKKTKMEPLHKETWSRMVWGLKEQDIFPSCFYILNKITFFLVKWHIFIQLHSSCIVFLSYFHIWCNTVNHGANHFERKKKTEQLGEIPAHSNPGWRVHGLCTFAHKHAHIYAHKAVCWRGLCRLEFQQKESPSTSTTEQIWL